MGEEPKNLRYGKVLFYTDADVDGNSISGLLINFFAKYWPSLFDLGMIWKVDTPLMVAKKGTQVLSFYSDEEYKTWESTRKDLKNWNIAYKKGLAALENDEYKQIIQNPNAYRITRDDWYRHTLDAWFAKDSSPRKDLIMNGPPVRSSKPQEVKLKEVKTAQRKPGKKKTQKLF